MRSYGRRFGWNLVIFLFVVLLAAGCSTSTPEPTEATTPTAIATMAAPAAPATATPAPATPAEAEVEAATPASSDASTPASSEAATSEPSSSEVITETGAFTESAPVTGTGEVVSDTSDIVSDTVSVAEPSEVVSETATVTESVDATTPITSTESVTGSTSAAPVEGAALLTVAPWTLETINEIPALESLAVTAHFGTDWMLTGDTGCNDYSAGYTLTGDGSKGQIAITGLTKLAENACRSEEAATQEEAYLQRLPLMTTYASDDFLLELCNADGSDCIHFVSDISEVLERTEWIAVAYQNGMGELTGVIPSQPPMTALFADGRVKGYTGCIYFEAKFDRTEDNITISNLQLTAASSETADCDPQLYNQQILYTEALSKATSFDARLGSLTLLDENGEAVVAYGVFAISPDVE